MKMPTNNYHTLLESYIQCLKEERFYDAHEALEAIWFPRRFEDDKEIKLLKGFINAAVSFELIKRGRKEASIRVWKNYIKYKPLLLGLHSPYIQSYEKISLYIEELHKLYHP